jgi:hypothetical protein
MAAADGLSEVAEAAVTETVVGHLIDDSGQEFVSAGAHDP